MNTVIAHLIDQEIAFTFDGSSVIIKGTDISFSGTPFENTILCKGRLIDAGLFIDLLIKAPSLI